MGVSSDLGAVRYPVPSWEPSGRWPHVDKWTWDHWVAWLRLQGRPDDWIALYRDLRDRWGISLQPLDKRTRKPVKDAPLTWVYRPTPHQVVFHQSREPFVLYGGARGGGKSHALRWDAYKRCLTVPNYRAILFRRMLTELEEYHIDRATTEVPLLTGGRGAVVADECRFGNGSKLKFGHCKDIGDESKYLGAEYDWIGFDQWEEFVQSQTVAIMGSGRSVMEGVTSMVRGTANPGGPDPQHLIDLFIDKRGLEGVDGYEPALWRYIPARVYDNPYLMDPDGSFRSYVQLRLAMYDPIRRRQMLDGDWRAREGQFFREFGGQHTATIHEVLEAQRPRTTWIRGLKYSYNAWGCVGWYCFLPNGRLVKRRDFKFQGLNLSAPAQAPLATREQTIAHQIQRIDRELGVPPATRLICAPDLSDPNVDDGIAALQRVGLRAVAGEPHTYLGWIRTRAWLANAPDGRPWLVFHPTDCAYTLRSLPTLVQDRTKPDEIDPHGDLAAAFETKLVLMARPAPSAAVSGPVKHVPNTAGWWIAKARAEMTG